MLKLKVSIDMKSHAILKYDIFALKYTLILMSSSKFSKLKLQIFDVKRFV